VARTHRARIEGVRARKIVDAGQPRQIMSMAAAEHEEKLDRVARVAQAAGVQGVLLAAHHNIAWLTSGRANRIDASRETGTARLLIAADGRRFVLANAIEMPRLQDEALAGLDYQPIEYAWTDDQDPSHAVRMARTLVGNGARLAADWPLPDVAVVESTLARARAPLTDGEIERYRALGADAGRMLGAVCRALTPGDDERDISRAVMDGATALRARPVVSLVGSDERLRRYRHPVPTATAWKHVVMVALCAERDGLVVSLSRIVSAGGPSDLDERTRATAAVFGALLDATRPGAGAASLYGVAGDAYAAAGFPGEERKHHQGGAIGYRTREWVAHPRAQEVVQARQAFAWNPTIAGTKIEDTALVIDDRLEMLTSTPDWPSISLGTPDRPVHASDIWRLT
ncbi:MAG TPA: M24 family metallopeptidase, partial [Vicinamibacterales bacterium]|nr:M24 family metallopeptidase [Vicinamibacterales bacterium]